MLDNYRFGIEEEFFLSERTTRQTLSHLPKGFHTDMARALPDAMRREMLMSQVEVATPPQVEMGRARELLLGYRQTLAHIGDQHELLVMAAGTHPTARWDAQKASPKARYHKLMDQLQMLGSRNIVCGLHVHVSVPDPAKRIDLMRRVIPYLPLFLALSTSSPFWQSRRTGLMGYRLAAYDELPRTGIPELFPDEATYRSYVNALQQSGAIPDESHIWWAVRPSSKYPTLELRIADSCTHVDHTIAIAALYRCLVRRLFEEPSLNRDIGAAERAITVENKWIAQRYGIHGVFIDAISRTQRNVREMLDELISMLHEDAVALDCVRELQSVRQIVNFGTSACQQIARQDDARSLGRSDDQALADVVDWLAQATRGLEGGGTPTVH